MCWKRCRRSSTPTTASASSPAARWKRTAPDRFSLRVLAMEGQLEVYVNDTLFLQYGIRTEAKIEVGVFAMNGQAEFRNLTVYELEK